MKKSILWMAFAMAMIACSSDGDERDIEISEEQLNAIKGTWHLTEYNVNPPQDVNNDESSSENLVEEMDCLTGTLTLTGEFEWSLTITNLNVTPITGGQFGIVCTTTSTTSGAWLFLNNEVVLSEGAEGHYRLNGNTLTRDLGGDLPEIRQHVFVKQ